MADRKLFEVSGVGEQRSAQLQAGDFPTCFSKQAAFYALCLAGAGRQLPADFDLELAAEEIGQSGLPDDATDRDQEIVSRYNQANRPGS